MLTVNCFLMGAQALVRGTTTTSPAAGAGMAQAIDRDLEIIDVAGVLDTLMSRTDKPDPNFAVVTP